MQLQKQCILLLALLLAAMAMVPTVSAEEEKQISEDFSISHIRPDDFQATVVIQNGFSLSKEENLTSIPTGSIIQHSDDGITRVFDSRGNQLIRSVDNDSPKIPTPKGVTSAVNINQIPNGSFVQVNDDGITNVFLDDTRILTVISPTKSGRDMMMVPSTNGWIESSYKRGITQLGQFIADWKVPSSPPNPATGSIIYIFNAIIPSGDTGIVQPVLEYNYARPHQWTAAPWYGSNGVYYRGSTINTAEGHTIRGTLGWNSNLNRWNIIIQDIGNGGYSSSFSTNAPNVGTNNIGAFCALEGWHINNDNDVPGKIVFSNIRLRDVNLNTVSFAWEKAVSSDLGLTNLDVTWNGMTPVTLWTNNP